MFIKTLMAATLGASAVIGLSLTNIQAYAAMTQSTPTPAVTDSNLQQPVLNIQHWQTAEGTPVYFVATPQIPIVDIEVMFNAGASRDGNKPGLAQLTNSLLDEGTATLKAEQISEQLDNSGAIYTPLLDRDMGGISLRSLTDPKFLDPALATFHQIITAPDFSQDAVERLKNQALVALQQDLQQPDTVAKKFFVNMLYGNQPYGHPILGTSDSIPKLQRTDVEQFYRQYYVARNAMIVIVGDLTNAKAHEVAQAIIEGLPPGKLADPLPPATSATLAQQKAINFPTQQTSVLIGQISITPQDPDYIPLTVGNYVLGSDPLVSELSLQVRSQHGWAYHVASLFSPLQAGGPFAIFLQTRNTEAQNAINLAKEILANFIKQGPNEQQLADAKKNLIGSFPLGLDSNADIINQLAYMVFYHLPLDYLDTYRAKINAVTVEQVRAAFQKHLRPADMVTVTVGGMSAPVNSEVATAVRPGERDGSVQ